ncbi:hypothetical protein ACWA5Z_12355 [Testudinibacter sp. P80/BLE/0925]|uniref:hypothetical protein n=1 Tax=Testudinibacter sp. TW-1 TaxID=3417757 RepID=UPI003D36867E
MFRWLVDRMIDAAALVFIPIFAFIFLSDFFLSRTTNERLLILAVLFGPLIIFYLNKYQKYQHSKNK